MKKIMYAAVVVSMVFATSVYSFASKAGSSSEKGVNVAMTTDHEHKPCHATKSNGNRCGCTDCRGNNWGNSYCTRCDHSVSQHY